MRVIDAATGRDLCELALPERMVAVAFAPDGRALAGFGSRALVTVYDAATLRRSATISPGTGELEALAFSPDGRRLAVAAAGPLVVCDASGGKAGFRVEAASASKAVQWAPGGAALAAGGEDGRVRVIEASSGEVLATLAGHADEIQALAFSADGQRLASGGERGRVRVWEIASARAIAKPDGSSEVLALAFSADGRVVAAAGTDGRVLRWNATTGAPIGAR
jgi:WD40 repeat protein